MIYLIKKIDNILFIYFYSSQTNTYNILNTSISILLIKLSLISIDSQEQI